MEQEPRRRRRLRAGEPATESSGSAAPSEARDAKPDRIDRSHADSPGRDLADGDGGAVVAATATAEILDPDAVVPARRTSTDDIPDRDAERGLRVLVGAGSSQVSLVAAMRARDAARATDDDVAASEASLVIVRRGWVPREQLPRTSSDNSSRVGG